jgi:RHS repeat-associated protein
VITKTVTIGGGVPPAISTTTLDGLGRTAQTALTSDPDCASGDRTDTTYDGLGRVRSVSSPYCTSGDSTYGLTTYTYDALGRTNSITEQDNSVITTSYSGNCTTVADPAGKSRKSCSDALGRITRVWEDPGTSPHMNYETDYAYDVLNNLTCAVQKGTDTTAFSTCAAAPATWRPRSFNYDSLSRLTNATNPESGATSYSYDPNSNLITKTSPKPNQTGTATVTATYSYEALNRLTQKSFNDGLTPTAKYGYDGLALTGCATTPPALADINPVGASTAMCDGAGAESWSHDPMGRVLTDARNTNGVTKNTVYTYLPYVDGSLNTLAYPSGRTITYTPTAAERLRSAVDSTGPINYALYAKYAPQGALASLQNGGSLYSTFLYNNRLQPCWMFSTNTSAGAPTSCTQTGVANAAIRDYQFNFNLGAADNGNVVQIANRRDPTRTQNFTYDALNRVATAQTQTTGVTIPNSNCWGLTFGYDAWGNLLSQSATGPAGCGEPLPLNVAVNTSNRIVTNTVAGQVTNYCYDAAGNLIHTVVSPATCPASGPYQYAYDGENHITSTAGVNYSYDGNGNRVMKSNGKLYWYGTSTGPLDETDLAGNTGNPSFKEYVFFNGTRIASRDSSNNVDYYFADHLGSARVITNAGGTPLDDSDFYPFGVERPILSSSGNNYKFTGQERDTESYLDNFGARYYASTMGRFMSPDPGNVGATPDAPQSWNAYSYVLNKPLIATDRSGLDCIYANDAPDNPYPGGIGTATVVRGDCINAGGENDSGVFVDGTVDTDDTVTVDPTTGDLSFGLTNDEGKYGEGAAPNFLDPQTSPTADAPPTSQDYLLAIHDRLQLLPEVCSVGISARFGPGKFSGGFQVSTNGQKASFQASFKARIFTLGPVQGGITKNGNAPPNATLTLRIPETPLSVGVSTPDGNTISGVQAGSRVGKLFNITASAALSNAYHCK